MQPWALGDIAGLFYYAAVEAFEELYCRISALELLVFAMAGQIDKKQFTRDLAVHKERLLATATFASLSPEVAERLTATIERYARVVQGRKD